MNKNALTCSVGLGLILVTGTPPTFTQAAEAPVLVVPVQETVMDLTVDLPADPTLEPGTAWQLSETSYAETVVPVFVGPAPESVGQPSPTKRRLMASIPATTRPTGVRRFKLTAVSNASAGPSTAFRWRPVNETSLGLWEGARPVMVYNHGVMSRAGVPADRNRSTYIHPLYGLDGETLTDDFPKDHYHHRGLFWAWPHVKADDREYDLWTIIGIHQRFERWLLKSAGPAGACLAVENGWYAGEKKVLQERIWIQIYPAQENQRRIDVECFWIPVGSAVTLQGAGGKSYGGMTLRFAPRTDTVITTPLGQGAQDLQMTQLAWADLSAQFADAPQPSGAAIFIHPAHPDYPPQWLTRHYGALCVGWPGVQAQTFEVGTPIQANYRVWVHRGTGQESDLLREYGAYADQLKLRWE